MRGSNLTTFRSQDPVPTFRLPLELNHDRAWGRPPAAPERIEDAVILGKPLIRPVTRDRFRDEPGMRLYLPDADKAPEFYFVTFSCTFKLPRPWRFEDAWIRIVLENADDIEPTARKISYELAAQTSTISGEVKAGTPPFTVTRSQSDTRKDLIVEPLNEGTSFPEWRLSQKVSSSIEQPPRFSFVVDTPARGLIQSTVIIGARIIGPNVLFDYDVPLEETRRLNWLLIEVP